MPGRKSKARSSCRSVIQRVSMRCSGYGCHLAFRLRSKWSIKNSDYPRLSHRCSVFCVNDLIHGGLDAIQRLHPHGLAQRQHPRSRFQFQREVWPSFQSLAPLGKLLAGKLVWSEFKTQRPAEFSTHPSLGATPVVSPQGERHLELSLARVSQYFRAAMARCQRQCGPQIWGQTEGKIPISSEIWLTKNRDWMIPRKE